MEDIITFAKGKHVIIIRNRGSLKVIDEVVTAYNGELAYSFPASGRYDLICKDRPELSKFDWVVGIKAARGQFGVIIVFA